jgi:hypothetical protein
MLYGLSLWSTYSAGVSLLRDYNYEYSSGLTTVPAVPILLFHHFLMPVIALLYISM